jgi:hypothetical protein
VIEEHRAAYRAWGEALSAQNEHARRFQTLPPNEFTGGMFDHVASEADPAWPAIERAVNDADNREMEVRRTLVRTAPTTLQGALALFQELL